MPLRPPLLQLGITYRRIPVAIIGDEVFFDTNLIFVELERRFTPKNGHPSLLCESMMRCGGNFFQLLITWVSYKRRTAGNHLSVLGRSRSIQPRSLVPSGR